MDVFPDILLEVGASTRGEVKSGPKKLYKLPRRNSRAEHSPKGTLVKPWPQNKILLDVNQIVAHIADTVRTQCGDSSGTLLLQ